MILTEEQIAFYHDKGYLIVENLFTASEIEALQQEAEKFNRLTEMPNVILEESGAVRSVFAPNLFSEKYEDFYREERLVVPSRQLLQNDIYLYQFKLNNKKAFVGDWWEWHQDFPYWHFDDGVKNANMISAMILMQDTRSIQGPLVFIPETHKHGIVNFEPKDHLGEALSTETTDLKNSLGADLKYTISNELVSQTIQEFGFVEAVGAAGTCFFFHPNLFHASNSNISPYERNTAIVTYNDVNNPPENKKNNRPEYLCSRDFRPIEKLKIAQ